MRANDPQVLGHAGRAQQLTCVSRDTRLGMHPNAHPGLPSPTRTRKRLLAKEVGKRNGWTAVQSNFMKKPTTLIAIVGVAVLLTGSLSGGTTIANHRPCLNPKVVIALSQPEDCEIACTGAIEAISFLEANGLRLAGPINIFPMGRIPATRIT